MPFVSAVTLPADREPHRRTDRLWATIALLFLLAPAAFTLPRAVNAAAWLAGAGRPDTFTGYSYGTQCAGSNCQTVTYGTQASTGQVITWPGRAPLGKPEHFRDPVWNPMSPRTDESVPDALVGVALGLVFDAVALTALAVFTVRARRHAAHGRTPRPYPAGG
jgi:hypothetical protein